MEEWRDIPGYEGVYQASSVGNIRSLDHYAEREAPGRAPHKVRIPGKVLTPKDNGHGYLQVGLNGKTPKRVHCLIAMAFLGPKPARADVRHLDGNKLNNSIENLCYGSRTENNRDVYRLGQAAHAFTAAQVFQIRKRIKNGERICVLAKEFGVNRNSISHIKNGRTFAWLTEQSVST